jgi:isopenicillin-N epimerase
VGSSPAPVLRAVFASYQKSEMLDETDPEDYPIWGYAAWNQFRDPLAEFVGSSRNEIALLRNATEANSYIANGVDLKPGDEVLMTDQEHPGGEQPWNLKAKRYGIVVKKVTLPKPVPNAAAVLNLFNDAITPKTKVMFFSHITTVTGVVLPAKELAALARSKGILSAVDGAHVPGMMKLNVGDLGCDYYSASPHKWLQAPKGSGFLFVRDEVIDRTWNTIATEGWEDHKIRAERFQRIGSSNVPALSGLRAHRVGKSNRDGAHREAPSPDGRLHPAANDSAWSIVVDFTGRSVAVWNCHRDGGARKNAGPGIVDVEGKEDSHTRRGASKNPPINALLRAAQGCGPLSGRLR